MWFDGIRQPNTLYVASVSRGKDSTAMLRAIQLMGWPLDAICSVDIWFDDETPAELPPMVAFKDEWDKKCLDRFGVPVTRLCAEKRSQICKVERERERADRESRMTRNVTHESLTQATSIASEKAGNSSEHMSVSQCNEGRGAKNSNTNKLTYVDIFYRKVSVERERERIAALQKLERKFPNLRIPDHQRRLVSVIPQTIGTYVFPNNQCRWCTGELKNYALTDSQCRKGIGVLRSKQDVFQPAPERGAENKYRSLYRHRRRRAEAHRKAYAEAG